MTRPGAGRWRGQRRVGGGRDPHRSVAIGMAFAVLIDASLVRMVLVPAIMSLLGEHAWWMPRWLEPVVPRLQLEGSAAAEAETTSAGSPR